MSLFTREQAMGLLEKFVAQYEPPDALGLVCGEKRALQRIVWALRETDGDLAARVAELESRLEGRVP